MTKIISLSSQGSGCGKDAVARILVENYGYLQFSWASELRRQVARKFPDAPPHYLERVVPHIKPNKEWEQLVGFGDSLRKYSDRKKILSINCCQLDILDQVCNRLVISDTRFPEEVAFLKKLGEKVGTNVKLVEVRGVARRGFFEFDNLLSSVTWDYNLDNFGTIPQLTERVREMLEVI